VCRILTAINHPCPCNAGRFCSYNPVFILFYNIFWL
jgi:hypothetical protein